MNIDEMYRLANWFADQFPRLNNLYSGVLDPINHNASQPDKRTIEGQLNELTEFLASQPLNQLSLEQLKMLSLLGVEQYIGREGAAYVEAAVRTSNYDPATAVQRLSAAIQSINSARDRLAAYAEAVTNLGLGLADAEAEGGLITIRVGFQSEAAINNVADWKNTAKDWYEIVRGLAMACDEKPEDVKVLGASTGSVILIMAGTAVFTGLLATIARHMTTTAKDVIGVRVALEELRQKKLLTKAMETEFKKIEKEKVDGAMVNIQKLLDGNLKLKDGEVAVALTNSIKKLLDFSEKGGTVDFVAPPEDVEDEMEADEDVGIATALTEARAAILEYQSERESLKLLSDGTKGRDL